MVTPTKKEIAKKKSDLEKHLKCLDEDGRIKQTKAISALRSAIRLTWMRSPNKLAVLEMARVPDMNPATRTKWLFKCAICGNMFKQADIEVDHIIGNHKFTEPDDFQSYWDNVLNVPISGLQVLCKDNCHSVKTYMERVGCTWQEAVDKKVIIRHNNLPVKKQKTMLQKEGFKPAEISNAEKREKCWTKLYEAGKIK